MRNLIHHLISIYLKEYVLLLLFYSFSVSLKSTQPKVIFFGPPGVMHTIQSSRAVSSHFDAQGEIPFSKYIIYE